MKSVVRWSTTVGLVGGILLGSLFAGTAQVQALTDEQVMERLRPVPVFALAGADGQPLVASPAEGQQGPSIANVFISQQDAQTFLSNLREQNPEVAGGVQVVPVSLAEVYQLANANNRQDGLAFAFIPMQQQVEAARTVLQQDGANPTEFEGVPIFTAQSSTEEGVYLTITRGEEQVIPIFLEREGLQAMLDRLSQVEPELASSLVVEVDNLEGLIEELKTSDNEALNQILLVPPRESIEFIQSLQQRQGQRPGQQPAPARPNQQRRQQPAQ
ncbi:hypothetical protein IQ268_29705 [Oculatella sp. LEGE 06141]|uniref:Tic22 family protein n=1 Tax=Oculatella sp. LEGE 06141 TaxID=1828648 RepID=UPI0018805CCC|nr:Tic22 family protein [Oculatella sp. LEGE 06141]MBE9182716.1 hypothetical protein [Oculatella sp. LEGE 06141]